MGDTLVRSVIRDRAPRSYTRGEMIFQQADPVSAYHGNGMEEV